jgi:hypothetical protein
MSEPNEPSPGRGPLPGASSPATAAGLGALTMTVHTLPPPEELLLRERTAAGRLKMLLVLLVCAAPVIASYFTYYVIRPEGGSAAYGRLIQPAVPMPERTVATLDGRPLPLRSLTGQWLLVSVGPAACGADCERRLFLQRQLREMTGRDRDRIDKLWIVTDGAPVSAALRAALEATPAMHIVRMPRAEVEAWLRADGGRDVDEHLYVVDPVGDWMMRMPAKPDPSKVRRDLDRLLRASAGWDRPGR